MLRDAYKGFTMKHFDQIMRKLGIDEAELKEAFDLIRSLDPKPGEGDIAVQTNYITPDFTVVREDDDGFRITLNGRNAPELRVNRHYRNMWNDLSARGRAGNSEIAQTKDFLKTRMESARWFINSIQQRRNTMLRVMEAIVSIQEEFFTNGMGSLKPMILKDIAEIIEMDISTVSRVVNGKYVQTEFGVYELKFFFSEGITGDDGEEVLEQGGQGAPRAHHRGRGQVRAALGPDARHDARRRGLPDRAADGHEVPRAVRAAGRAPAPPDRARIADQPTTPSAHATTRSECDGYAKLSLVHSLDVVGVAGRDGVPRQPRDVLRSVYSHRRRHLKQEVADVVRPWRKTARDPEDQPL